MSNTIDDTAFECKIWNMIKTKIKTNILSKIPECFSEIGLPYEETEIDKLHRIGNPL